MRVCRPRRGRTLLQCAGATVREVRTGAVGGQDAAHPVQSAPTRRENQLRVSGVRVSVGQGSQGERSPQAPHGPQETPQCTKALHRVVQGEPPPAVTRTLQAAERQTPWVLQLLRSPRERRQPARVLQQGHADFTEVAQSAQPTPQLHLARLHGSVGALQSCPTTDRRTTQDETGSPQDLSRPAVASIAEEPGARKPHAGICAGAVG